MTGRDGGVRRLLTSDSGGAADTADGSLRLSFTDVVAVALVPAVLVAVFSLPEGTRREFALLYTEPTLRTLYTAHFVHLSFPHLAANLLVYLLVVPFSLFVSVWSGRRRRFYVVALVVLVIFPVVLSGLNVLFPRPRLGMGFSGLNLAFVGYLPHVLADRFEAEQPEWDELRAALLALAFFVGTAIVTLRVLGSIGGAPRVGLVWLFAAGLGSLLAATVLTKPVVSCLRSQGFAGGTIPPLSALGSLLFVLVMVVGFPEVTPEGGSVVNLFLHLLGYSLGYLVPYVAFQVLGISVSGWSDRPAA